MVVSNVSEEEITRNILIDKLLQKCNSIFGYEMKWEQCSPLIKQIIDFKKNNTPECFASKTSLIQHNPDYYSSCGSVEHLISQYAIPILQLLCLFGNVINLLIYRLPYFNGSSSVHFLRAKALANLIFVQSRVFEVIHAWTYEPHPVFERTYWDTKPYFITIANISGTISTWMTFLVTIETVLCVLLPFSFRQYCTHKMTYILLVGSGIASLLLHLTFLATHTVVSTSNLTQIVQNDNDCWEKRIWFSVQTNPSFMPAVYEKVYYWTQMTVSITLPTIAMLVCSVLILTRFTLKELGEAFSQRRKCVIRMTVATTVSHLLFEGPALLTFGAAALKGAGSENHNTTTCILNHANNLLSMVNATIPFFVFLACNQQFRHMTLVYLRAQFECSREKKKALLAQASSRIRTTRGETERSFIDQTLIAKVSTI